ncbi:hypothetical protein [Aerococcus kribbianus]|uniref:Uncharacterized protein n=1 Tax=Aerococcus kribbianus TaxID=2999064 RepID=A0A9X3JG57_9LACT|nr:MULTISPECIES: hypothetical protein [unclassified Aerococcus]MCZ0716886.1 hypothetical protein [Aerococcus sp. YH-aer221]MCZ0725174.1 hypothetical protein [Aerococcus sp. YH-aer222]
MALMDFHQSNIEFDHSQADLKAYKEIYADYEEIPYLSKHRDLPLWLETVAEERQYIVSKSQMVRFSDGLLPGHIILLWRVGFNTLSNQSILPLYFEYNYGINPYLELDHLLADNYVAKLSVHENLDWHKASQLKQLLKEKKVKGLSKAKKADLVALAKAHFTDAELDEKLTICGFRLTDKGKSALKAHQDVVDKHPKKKL